MKDEKAFWDRLKILGHDKTKQEELRLHCTTNIEKVLKYLPSKILRSDAADCLNCLLNGIPDIPAALAKQKVKVLEVALKTLGKESTSAKHCSEIASRICMELPKLSTANIVKISEICIQAILANSDVNLMWKEVLPQCIRVLSDKPTVIVGSTEMSPTEYRKQVVCTITRGSCNRAIQLAAMFREFELDKEEHNQAVSKLCSCMKDFAPEDLPPLVHQLLKLTRNMHMEIVLAHLSNYFNLRLYSKLDPPILDSDQTNFELEDFSSSHTPAEVISCMCTCVYHAKELSCYVHKKILATPKLIILKQPFIVRLTLTFSEIDTDFKESCIGLIRSAIQQQYILEQKMKDSAWLRSLVHSDIDITKLLKIIVSESATNPEMITFGLINLAFVLLSTSTLLGRESLAHQCWYYGKLILIRLVRSQPAIAPQVLKLLADKMSGDANAYQQCAEVTQLLCQYAPLCLMEGMTHVNDLMEGAILGAGAHFEGCSGIVRSAARVGASSARLRDIQVLLCRKGLFHQEVRIRCNGLGGLLALLETLRVNSSGAGGASSLSESNSAHSYLTQISLHATQQGTQVSSYVHNETVCLEVLSMLKRCLKQDAVVKQILYREVYDCIVDKPASIQTTALSLLCEQFEKYRAEESDSEGAQPILFEKCLHNNGVSVTLQEPIGQLIMTLSKLSALLMAETESDECVLSQGAVRTASTLSKHLNTLVTSFASQEHDTSMNEAINESRSKQLILLQKMQCVEALVAYEIISWSTTSTETASNVFNLYKTHNQYFELTKTTKSAKKSSKPNESTKETQSKSQRTQKGKEKNINKSANTSKEKAGALKPLPCIWDLATCARICELLYAEEVTWSSTDQRNQLRSKREFHHFAHRNIRSTLTEWKHRKEHLTEYLRIIAAVLFRRCLMRFEDLCDFDELTALNCLETFRECIITIATPHNHLKIKDFLRDITNNQEASVSESCAIILESIKSALASQEDETSTVQEDLVSKKITSALLLLVNTVYAKLSPAPCPQLNEVSKWFEQLIRSSSKDYLGIVPTLLSANNASTLDISLVNDLISAFRQVLGSVNDEEESETTNSEVIPSLSVENSAVVCVNVCSSLIQRISHIDLALARLKSYNSSFAFVIADEKGKISKQSQEIERGLVVELHSIASCCTSLLECRVRVGVPSERTLSTVLKLYNALVNFAKQLIGHTADDLYAIRFEKLLKVSGKKLSTALDNFVTYVESVQCNESRGKLSAAQILRDTQLIPRVVCQTEIYYKQIIVLANKCKVDFQQYLSHGTARDFRLNAAVMREALSHHQQDASIDDAGSEQDNTEEQAIENEDVEDLNVEKNNESETSDESDAENMSPNKRPRL